MPWNIMIAVAKLGISKEACMELVKEFADQRNMQISKIRKGIKEEDMLMIKGVLHDITGVSATFAIDEITEIVAELREAANARLKQLGERHGRLSDDYSRENMEALVYKLDNAFLDLQVQTSM